jgi:hypothetical protein
MLPNDGTDFSLPPPWEQFLDELDKVLSRRVELHCLGGFVLAAVYGLPRPTGDLDYIAALPEDERETVQAVAGAGSELARKYRVHVQYVTIADVPDDYEQRLIEICPQRFKNLRLLALDPHDLVLSKLTRNNPVDDSDVEFLVRRGVLDPAVLRERYEKELRPKISNEQRHDSTLKLWLDYFNQ